MRKTIYAPLAKELIQIGTQGKFNPQNQTKQNRTIHQGQVRNLVWSATHCTNI